MAIALVDIPDRLEVYTYEDYLNFPDDGKRYEIIDGELFVSPAPKTPHQKITGNFFGTIWYFLQQNPLGEIYSAPTDVILSEINVLQPDVLFFSKRKRDILTRDNIQGAPDLVIEVFSPSSEKRDRTVKLKAYSKFGVLEYWMASEKKKTVEVWRRKGDKLVYHAIFEKTQTLTTPLLPGLEIALGKIFQK